MQDAGVTTMSASEAFSLVDGRQAPPAGQVGEDQDHLGTSIYAAELDATTK